MDNDFRRKKNDVPSKKVKNIFLNSSVGNNDRPIISKTNNLEKDLNDANRVFENSKACSNAFQSFQKNSLQNFKNILTGDSNVNFLRNKFEAVEELVQNKVDICFLSDTKIDETFPNQPFVINGYKLFRRDRICHGEGVLCYINENIPSKTVNVEGIVKECEIVLMEFSIKTRKWLFIGLYKPFSQDENSFLDNLSLIINRVTWQYKNFMLTGDFNMTIENKNLEVFMNSFGLECLIKRPTCFQSKNPNCIDLILANKKDLFKNSNGSEVGISDHHSLIITALKSQLVKGNAKTKLYPDYSEFNMDNFKAELDDKLKSGVVTEYSNFQNIFIQVLNNHAPAKKKIVRFNNNPLMTKTLRKVMHRSRLKNIFIRKRMIKIGKTIRSKEIFVLTFSVKLKQKTLKV